MGWLNRVISGILNARIRWEKSAAAFCSCLSIPPQNDLQNCKSSSRTQAHFSPPWSSCRFLIRFPSQSALNPPRHLPLFCLQAHQWILKKRGCEKSPFFSLRKRTSQADGTHRIALRRQITRRPAFWSGHQRKYPSDWRNWLTVKPNILFGTFEGQR